MKLKKGDNVIILSGKDRGRQGNILKVFPQKGKIVVEGLNISKKHVKAKRQGEKGQVVEVPSPMPLSNAQLFCQKCKKGSRIGYTIEGAEKVRICKRCATPFK